MVKLTDDVIERARRGDFKRLLKSYKIEITNEKWTICVFHADKNPSLNFDWDRNLYHCFGCQESGDMIKFVQEYEKLDFRSAIEKLLLFAPSTLNQVKVVRPVVDLRKEAIEIVADRLEERFFITRCKVNDRYFKKEDPCSKAFDYKRELIGNEVELGFTNAALESIFQRSDDFFYHIRFQEDMFLLKKDLEYFYNLISKKLQEVLEFTF